MKKNLRFIVAVLGITIATFGTITQSYAKSVAPENGHCKPGPSICGYTPDCQEIYGIFGN